MAEVPGRPALHEERGVEAGGAHEPGEGPQEAEATLRGAIHRPPGV